MTYCEAHWYIFLGGIVSKPLLEKGCPFAVGVFSGNIQDTFVAVNTPGHDDIAVYHFGCEKCGQCKQHGPLARRRGDKDDLLKGYKLGCRHVRVNKYFLFKLFPQLCPVHPRVFTVPSCLMYQM